MTIRRWQKRQRHGEEILTRFNSHEHDLQRREARKTGGGKAPASPSEVSKLVADVLPASVNPLEQTFDDDAGEQLDLKRDKDVREVITCEVGPSLLADLKAIGGKGAEKVTKKEDNQKYVIFNCFSNFSNDNLLHNSQLLIIRSHYINRYKRKKKNRIPWGGPIFDHGEGRTQIKDEGPEWKLVHQCDNMGIGLPPGYNTDEEHSQSNL